MPNALILSCSASFGERHSCISTKIESKRPGMETFENILRKYHFGIEPRLSKLGF
jgi:hypothetical protein